MMAIRCPECGRGYDVNLFEFGRSIRCVCGKEVINAHEERGVSFSRREEDEHMFEVKRLADRISFLITCTDYTEIDLEIEKEKLRDRIEELFPDKAHLYELIYEPRFIRLEEQLRREEDG
jgi:hypothetical protein